MFSKLVRATGGFLGSVARVAVSAWTWLALFSIGGFTLIVAALYVLAGLGWAMLALGIVLLVVAGFVMRGLSHG